MKIKKLPLAQALGHILLHHQPGPDGRRRLKKGTVLTETDLAALEALGHAEVYVAVLQPEDVPENEAARRLIERLAGPGLLPTPAATGRGNLLAQAPGLFKVNIDTLLEFNACTGIALATLPANTIVAAKKQVASLKIIPYAVPRRELDKAEALAGTGLVELRPFVIKRIALITTGSPPSEQKVIDAFVPPLSKRVAAFGAELTTGPYLPEDVAAIANALAQALQNGAHIILVAGETSIMDENDITPQAIKHIGGEIVQHGVPVEPGNLLLLAYHGHVPILGAPGCARSENFNVIDMVLPRLAAGERLVRRDLMALGHGGLLK